MLEKTSRFCLLIALLVLAAVPLAMAADERPPNLVFILADDLGYGDPGCYGAPDIRTPNIDRLAAEGVRFTDFYANGAICSPTRIAFLTGRYQQRLGMDNALYYQEMGRGLPEGGVTIASRLRQVGYATGISGKWHIGYDHERQPLQQGFDHFFGLLGGNHHYFAHMDRIGVPDLWLGNDAVEREGYSTNLFSTDAIEFVEENRDRPFFLYLSHAAPHFPWQGPDDVDKIVRPKKPEWQEGDRPTYIAMVERMDQTIGDLLAKLDELDLAGQTLVVFTSDNGGHTYSRNLPLRDYKGSLWEGGIRVPCIARWPGVIPAGTTTSQIGITMDWSATFAALAGNKAASDGDEGINLMPVITGKNDPIERTLFWRKRPGPVRKKVDRERAVRRGDWKYLEPAEGGPWLIDLSKDISETENHIAEHPELAAELKQKLDNWDAEMDAALAGR
ncbi:MAG: sulfatase [Verrucomicrobiae bacterium]|nr:sulfatase [Verrucomicrobiae bacterium]